MNSSLILNEAIDSIKEWTCECLDCDRAFLFIVDDEKEELYSNRIVKGQMIRMGKNEGIPGHVYAKSDTVNIPDAY